MSRVSTFLNFPGTTEEAFNFYRTVFGTEFEGEVSRFGDIPPQEGQPPIAETDKHKVMHVMLPVLGGHMLMGADAVESMGFKLTHGNNVYVTLEPDTRAETDRIFTALSEGGTIEVPLQDMFWGDYYGSLVDRYGIPWMFNCSEK